MTQQLATSSVSRGRVIGFLAITVVVAIVEAFNWHLSYALRMGFWYLYIPAAIAATYLLATAVSRRWMQVVAVVLGVVTYAEIGVLDHSLATREFRQLCEQEAGIRVYKTMYLPKEDFDETGLPRFVEKLDYAKELEKLGLEEAWKENNRYMGLWGWYRVISSKVVRSQDNVLVGETTRFTWEGGGPPLPLGRRIRTCENVGPDIVSELMRGIFLPVSVERQKE